MKHRALHIVAIVILLIITTGTDAGRFAEAWQLWLYRAIPYAYAIWVLARWPPRKPRPALATLDAPQPNGRLASRPPDPPPPSATKSSPSAEQRLGTVGRFIIVLLIYIGGAGLLILVWALIEHLLFPTGN